MILVRPCGSGTDRSCTSCKRAVCAAHARSELAADGAERVRCTECLRSSSTTRRRDDDDDFVSTGSTAAVIATSGDAGASADYGDQSGGAFGGAGATGGWDAAEAGGKGAPDAFSAEDLAAFDAISEADKDRGSPGYDS